MPLYPSFIALLPITPPGYALIGPVPALTILSGVGVLTFFVAVALWKSFGPSIFVDKLARAMTIYLGSMAIAGALGFVPIVGAVFCAITLCACIGATAVYHWGADVRVARYMTVSLLLSSGAAAVVALACWITRAPAALYAVGNGRAIGSFVVPGELAGYLGMLLPYTIGVAATTRVRWLCGLAVAVACVDVVAVTATFSRAGLLGLIASGVIAAAFLRPRLLPWLIGGVVLLATQLHRVVNLHHNPAENFNRFSIWHAALRSIELFPLWGVGPGGFARVYPFMKLPDGEPLAFHAHSFLLTTWAETGLIGVCGLATLWLTFLLIFRTRYRQASANGRIAGTAILAGFIATWLQSTVDVVQILFLGLWIPFMGMALVALEEGP